MDVKLKCDYFLVLFLGGGSTVMRCSQNACNKDAFIRKDYLY